MKRESSKKIKVNSRSFKLHHLLTDTDSQYDKFSTGTNYAQKCSPPLKNNDFLGGGGPRPGTLDPRRTPTKATSMSGVKKDVPRAHPLSIVTMSLSVTGEEIRPIIGEEIHQFARIYTPDDQCKIVKRLECTDYDLQIQIGEGDLQKEI